MKVFVPYAPEPRFGHPIGIWRPAFAWLPTRMFDGKLVWLRTYWTRRIQKYHYLDGGADFWWQNTDTGKPE